MSLRGPEDTPELEASIKEAIEKGISVVCAAGKEGDGKRGYDGIRFSWCL
jgi:major intracellular serine protease